MPQTFCLFYSPRIITQGEFRYMTIAESRQLSIFSDAAYVAKHGHPPCQAFHITVPIRGAIRIPSAPRIEISIGRWICSHKSVNHSSCLNIIGIIWRASLR